MTEMGHEEAYSELAAVALEMVPADIGDTVRAHASVCPECGPELAAIEETVAMLAKLVPESPMNRGHGAGIRSRLVMRARTEREAHSAISSGPPDLMRGVASLTGLGHRATPSSQRVLTPDGRKTPQQSPLPVKPTGYPSSIPSRFPWYAIAATIVLIMTGGQLLRVVQDRTEMRDQLAALAATNDTAAAKVRVTDSMAAMLSEKDAMVTAMAGPDVKVVALATRRGATPRGRMFWNRQSNDWTLVTYALPQPLPGKTYQVWLVTRDAKISAGTFKPDAQGKMMMRANYALARNALRSIAITEEPEGGMPAPTGPMVVSGSA